MIWLVGSWAATADNQLGDADAVRKTNALNGASMGLDGTQTGAAPPGPGKRPAYHDAAALRECEDDRTSHGPARSRSSLVYGRR